MVTDREREQLLERQARVYEVADFATKPAQWFIGGIKAVFLLLVFAGVCIIGPIYYFLHGGSFSSFQFGVGCWILGLLVMFFGAPWYTLFWGAVIFCSLYWWDINKDDASGNQFIAVLWLYEGVGLLLVAAKIVRWAKHRRQQRESVGDDTIESAATSYTSDEPQYLPTTEGLTPESRLSAVPHALIESKDTRPQRSLGAGHPVDDIDNMPLRDALNSTVAMFASVSSRMKDVLGRLQRGEYRTREEAERVVHEFMSMQRRVSERFEAVIARMKREDPTYPVAEFEQTLADFRASMEQVEEVALAKGLL